ncbi:hypothetical protein [Roseimicrobium sp. ORNL1]|uniref:hypothetical protein n=1 Tax=Roseimicrobium sp. ORNL1 TaxID=2711231 RepID=UPI0013E1AC31|nr:hypothetical protein [Roseimicrobium sp. ORNL1]QIF05533.1 hypothetical protein G5S37_29890 [Roseimicrobium sp. ORNL1]
MNTLIEFARTHLELFLRIVAVAQFSLVIANLFIARILGWKPEIDRMSLLVREVFIIHSWFITITLAIWTVLTWRFAHEMAHAPTELSRWLCWAMAGFWGIRCAAQWLHYSPSHWRGIPSRTFFHWLFFLGYGTWTAVYALAATA